MRDRLALVMIAVILLVMAVTIWLWWSDAVLVHKCRAAGGSWRPDARICAISADRALKSPASQHR
jgi:hypothetical protein